MDRFHSDHTFLCWKLSFTEYSLILVVYFIVNFNDNVVMPNDMCDTAIKKAATCLEEGSANSQQFDLALYVAFFSICPLPLNSIRALFLQWKRFLSKSTASVSFSVEQKCEQKIGISQDHIVVFFKKIFFYGEQKPPCCDALRSLQSHDASAEETLLSHFLIQPLGNDEIPFNFSAGVSINNLFSSV